MINIASNGAMGKVVAARLSPGEDILKGIERICSETNINNGLIMSGMGSLSKVAFYTPVKLPDKRAGYGYSNPILMDGPIELLNMTGMICHDIKGNCLFHIHFTISNQNGKAFGGHVIEGCKVLLTTDIVIAEINTIEMERKFDEDLEVYIFDPKSLKKV
ncbi:PPC domain-containing DNA-binding protein [Acidaminococcus sp. DS4831]|uniref:PPC domain-containing DNA-binding protein n=1 Tax=Acidaminococcus sp. DS4831 TaxID=3141399 RepID=UPI0032E3699F